jgi:hypothetical protein
MVVMVAQAISAAMDSAVEVVVQMVTMVAAVVPHLFLVMPEVVEAVAVQVIPPALQPVISVEAEVFPVMMAILNVRVRAKVAPGELYLPVAELMVRMV